MKIDRRIRLCSWLAALVVALLVAASTVSAQAVQLKDRVTDQTGVLSSGMAEVNSAIDHLSSDAKVDLWVLFVSTTGGTIATDAAHETYTANGFGGNDMVLLVAVDDHRYGWWEDTTTPSSDVGLATGLTSQEIDTLLSDNLDQNFRNGNWAGGVVSFANALDTAVLAGPVQPVATPQPVVTPQPPTPSGSTGSSSGDLGGLLVFFGIIIAFIGVLVLIFWLRAQMLARRSAQERQRHLDDLNRQANKALVGTDDAITAAKQELGFAQAEFTDEDCAPFAAALARAGDELKAAFTIRQQLDDSVPEDDPTKERMYGEILAHCQAAGADIDEQHKRLQALRDLEKTAPEALANIDKAVDALKDRLPEVQSAVKVLSGFAPSTWAAVHGNPEEADKRGAFAEDQIARGKAALAQTPANRRDAASSARAAQDAVAQANQLLDAVVTQARAAQDAESRLGPELAEAETDVEAARKASNQAAGAPFAAQLNQAVALLNQAKTLASSAAPDPIAALKSAQQAHSAVDAVLASERQAAEQAARTQAAWTSARASASPSIDQASNYMAARHTSLGHVSRTRLAEAQRHLAQADALAATDLVAATNEARTADNLADQAYAEAQSDFYGPGGFGGGGGGGGGGANVAGAILGGIILGGMLSGGAHRGGFGGTPWGSGGGWGGGHGGGFGGFGGGGGFGGFGGGGHGGGGGFGGGGGGHGGGGGW